MKVLVYGWYRQGNLGDDLFMEAFRKLFPTYDFVFTDHIEIDMLQDIEAVFFGGGSFLLDRPKITESALQELKRKKICYLGVGVESDIHPIHLDLMTRARIIATRSPEQLQKLQTFNTNVTIVPDLVYALQDQVRPVYRDGRSVLLIPNINVVPQRSEPHWKHVAWDYFKSEFTQFLDWLVENGYKLRTLSMCRAQEMDDDWAAAELIGYMDRRDRCYLEGDYALTLKGASEIIGENSIVITQRFHGIVLAEMTRTPYIAIHHHDKLKFSQPREGTFLSYYASSKDSFIGAFEKSLKMNFVNPLPIESTIFETFSEQVANSLK